MSFNGKVIIITGASSGIGADAARHLAKLGAKVSIIGRNRKNLDDVAEEIRKSGSAEPLSIVADVTKDAERIVNETIQHFGQLDVLINNAGIGMSDTAADINLSDFDRVFDTNVRAVINLTKLCIPHLEVTKGNVVNVSSVDGIKPYPGNVSYGMSKAALDQYTKCAALDLAPKGIRVNSINPGAVKTNFLERMGLTEEEIAEAWEGMIDEGVIKRIGEVTDTSAAIEYLADNKKSSFLTGILLPVDGGYLLQ